MISPPPHSVEAEQGVLGSMLISPRDTITECVEKINEEYFYVPAHQTIYNVLVDLWNAGQAIDLITFTQALRDRNLLESLGGAAFVTSLFTFVPTAANVCYYIDIVRDKYILREIIAAGTESVRRAYDATPPEDVADIVADTDCRMSKLRDSVNGLNGQLPQTDDGAELIAKPIVLPDDVIEGVLHSGGKAMFGGASKSNKTWLLTDTAVSVATGTDWLGKFPTKRGRVLYVNLEIQPAFFARRIKAICDERQLTIEPGYFDVLNLRGYAADLSTLMPRLLQRIGRGHYVLIILDPVYKLLGARDENKAGDIAALLNQVELLAVQSGAAVLFGAHYSKGNQSSKESIDRVGGSGVFARDPDTLLNFTKHEEDGAFTVEATLRNHAPVQPFVVRWEFPLFVVASELDPAELKKASGAAVKQFRVDQLVDLLTRPMSAAQFRKIALDETGMSRATFFRLFAEAKTSGTITTNNGKWERK